MEQYFTIISRSTDNEHTDTIENLVDFVNNHPDCRVRDYRIRTPRNFGNNPNPTFKLWLEHRGYTINRFGKAVKEVA